MTAGIRLLSVEDNDSDDVLMRRELRRAGVEVAVHRRVDTFADLTDALSTQTWDVCICDFNVVSFNALSALQEIKRRKLDLPTIVVTGSLDEEQSATIFRAGARDLVRKGRLGRLGPAVERELHEAARRGEALLAAAQLSESQALFDAVMRHLPTFVFVKDEQHRFLFANDELLRFFGKTLDQLVGKTPTEALGPEVGRRLQVGTSELREAREPALETTERFVGSDGSERDYGMIRFRIGERSGLTAGIGFDLTERSRAAEALRANEARFRTIAEVMADGMVTVAAGGQIRYANLAVERMLGRTRAEIAHMDDLVLPADRAGQSVELAEAFRAGALPAGQVVERTLLAKDGTLVPVEVSAALWELGGEQFVTCILRDTRARRALEEQMRHAQKLEAVGQLASGVAHDFNNILGVISAYAELMSEIVIEEEVRDDIAEIRLAVRRGATLVRQLLMFSRKQVVNPVFVDPDEVVREMEMMLGRAAGPRIVCSLELDGGGHSVLIDRGHLEQVLMNLVVNARDAIGSQRTGLPGRIVVATRWLAHPEHELGTLMLSVSDNGAGMDEATKAHVFEPFFTTKEPGKGTGLGLSTVHGIVDQAGGTIEVESVPEQGTTFSVTLHCVHPTPTPRTERTNMTTGERPMVEDLGHRAPGETIVLVEQERGLRAAVANTLRREGHNVIELRHAAQALEVTRALGRAVGLVLTDLEMSGMSGVDLLRALRAAGSSVPVLVMSGAPSDPELAALEVPSVFHVQKPVVGRELLARVRMAIEASPERTK